MLFEFTEVNTQKNFRNNKINVTNDFIRGINWVNKYHTYMYCVRFRNYHVFFFGEIFLYSPSICRVSRKNSSSSLIFSANEGLSTKFSKFFYDILSGLTFKISQMVETKLFSLL